MFKNIIISAKSYILNPWSKHLEVKRSAMCKNRETKILSSLKSSLTVIYQSKSVKNLVHSYYIVKSIVLPLRWIVILYQFFHTPGLAGKKVENVIISANPYIINPWSKHLVVKRFARIKNSEKLLYTLEASLSVFLPVYYLYMNMRV